MTIGQVKWVTYPHLFLLGGGFGSGSVGFAAYMFLDFDPSWIHVKFGFWLPLTHPTLFVNGFHIT